MYQVKLMAHNHFNFNEATFKLDLIRSRPFTYLTVADTTYLTNKECRPILNIYNANFLISFSNLLSRLRKRSIIFKL